MHSEKPLPTNKPLNVLILDDERVDRHRLARLCSGLPNATQITNAQTLSEFADELAAAPFDLLLVDHILPDGTGLDALQHIRLSADNLNAATIMVTGHADDRIAQAALSAGCADYLTKDELSPRSFQRAVANALQKSVLTTQVAAQTYRRAEVEQVLERFAGQCARDIKPMLSRMMRQIRDLRAADAGTAPTSTPLFGAIEGSCDTLWRFLVELEGYQGTDLLPANTVEVPSPVVAAKKPRKPPSLFARSAH